MANTPRGSWILDALLSDEVVAAWIEHRIGVKAFNTSPTIDEAVPDRLMDGFGGLTWLFTPSPAARGISQLLLDEAVYLYQVLQNLEDPRVAEIGRWKGGTTFLMAAAGARVVSFDIEDSRRPASKRPDRQQAETFRPALERALAASGLDSRVELIRADARTWNVEPCLYDLVYLDIPVGSVSAASDLFERWRVGLRDGGRVILREGGSSHGHQAAFVATLGHRSDLVVETWAPGSFAVVSVT